MIIQSSKDLRQVRRAVEEASDANETSAVIKVADDAAGDEAAEHLSSLAAKLGRDGRATEISIRTSGSLPEVESLLKGVSMLSAEPRINYERTATGAVLGGIGGVALGSILNETMKLGQQSGNPLISSFAIACGLGGVAVGGGLGARLIDIIVQRDGDGWSIEANSRES